MISAPAETEGLSDRGVLEKTHPFSAVQDKNSMSSDDEGEKEKALQTVTGYVDHIVFRNEENGYTVFHLDNDDGEVTCVGNFNFISEGEMMELEGEYVNHNVYGYTP